MDNLLKINLALFSANTNVTTDEGLTNEMKTYYSDYLIDIAEPELIHDQFGQKHPIPANGGKTIEFRKYSPLAKALTPLTEGVTPDGQKLTMSVVTATVAQYGGYIELSDVVLMTAIDNNLVQATELLGSQAGRTLDTVVREVLNGGTNVQFANGAVNARYKLVGGSSTAANNHYLTVDAVKRAVRFLKVMNAPKIDGAYVGIIHPDCAYDLMGDSDWKYPHQYVDTQNIYEGEIGMIAGVRFVESSEAKIFHADAFVGTDRELAANGAVSASTTITYDGAASTIADNALKGRFIIVSDATNGDQLCEVTANTSTTITVKSAITCLDNAKIFPGEAGAEGRDVYSTLILGANAYGSTELANGGLQHIVKQLGSSGTSDPLNQRATAGWKATKVAERLVEAYMIRIETASTFEAGAN